MQPRLVGRYDDFHVDLKGTTIGRDQSNTLQIDDPLVSSFHCRIDVDDEGYVLVDCNSTNGTFVNGRLIDRVTLAEYDSIRIGQTEFRFTALDSNYIFAPFGPAHLENEDRWKVRETVELNPAAASLLQKSIAVSQEEFGRVEQSMRVLLKLGVEINESSDSESLQRLVLKRIFELVPADNGAIVLSSAKGELILQNARLHSRLPGDSSLPVSRTITETVMKTGKSVLRNHLIEDESASGSLKAAAVRSVLCVPLTVMGGPVGVLYLNTTVSEQEFTLWHLELVTAIGGIAAVALEHLRYVEWLETQNEQLKQEVAIRHDIVGQGPRMRKALEDIARVASGNARVLILGESGTGKELAARAIHNNSGRRGGPFVAVNCSAITESLFSSELFGHVSGAFTGADRDRRGFIEEASGGTLFLDEIGDLPPHLQPKLLRVIEEGAVYKVGSSKPQQVDIRLISATNRDLKAEIEAGRFRSDLFFRLGLPLEMPPLRARVEDIPLLVRFFLEKFRDLAQRELGNTPPETLQILKDYDWPGNVRELQGAIEWAVVFGTSDRIRPEDLPERIRKPRFDGGNPLASRLHDAREAYERQLILRALEETHGVVSKAALRLDRIPTYLHRRISQLGLRDDLNRIRLGQDRVL